MKAHLPSVFAVACVALWMTACHVTETHVRCASADDCGAGQDCYLGYCVFDESDAALSDRQRAVTADASRPLRRHVMPTFTEFADGQDAGVSMNIACVASDEDAGLPAGACCKETVACYEGPENTRDVGRCKAGRRRCKDGRLGSCEGSVLPRAEACDNKGTDDDCDGEIDNIARLGQACMVEADEQACTAGTYVCVGAAARPECKSKTTTDELCNQKDDDCDNKVDETFELQKDVMNCGACGVTCGNTQACCGGSCVTRRVDTQDGCPECSASAACAKGKSCCNGACRDTLTDHDNCGACGNACSLREACCAGKCVDTSRDAMNCGTCGNVCSQGTSPSCCTGACVDLSNDGRNCGRCGYSCGNVCTCTVTNGQPGCRGVLGVCF